MQFKRHEDNPVLQPDPNQPWMARQTRNPGVIEDGGKIRMVFTAGAAPTAGKLFGDLSLGYAESTDGIHFEVRPQPLLSVREDPLPFDAGSLEDVRITRIDGRCYLAYAGRAMPPRRFWFEPHEQWDARRNPTWSLNYRRVGLAVPADDAWTKLEKLGPITSEQMSDANVILFPEKFEGRYAMLHRPTPFSPGAHQCLYTPAGMWIAFSDDLLDWKWDDDNTHAFWPDRRESLPDDRLLIRPEYDWERLKIGGAGVPIPTDEGWLTLYHAVDMAGMYRVGVLLLDREHPDRVLARLPYPVFEPQTEFETVGHYKQGPGCVFPCANLVLDDEIFVYYGAMDRYTCLATVKLQDLLDEVLQHRIERPVLSGSY